jgi:hypothetical protein
VGVYVSLVGVTVNCEAGKPEYGTGLIVDGLDMFRFEGYCGLV